jgi:hypothetical protein
MRASRAELSRVERQFRVWRKKREGRRIPRELWDAAVGLLAEHSSSEVCRVLGLNPARFKVTREARRGADDGRRRRGGTGRATARPAPGRWTSRGGSGLPSGAFVELPPVAASSGGMELGATLRQGAQLCRLSIEGPMGALTITLPAIERDLADVVRRCVAAALGEPSAA